MKLFFTCHSGAEQTRDELRKQVYDAMAEEEKTGAVNTKLESEDVTGNTEVKEEVKHDVNGSEEPSNSPAGGEDEGSVQEAKVNGVAKSPVAPVNGVGEGPSGSPGKEIVEKVDDSKSQNGKTDAKPEEGKDESKPEAEQDKEETEGSKSLDTEHCLCGWVEHKLSIS